MTLNALAHIGSYAIIIGGLLMPAVSYADSSSPYDQSGTNPAQSNCNSKTGCASYVTGDKTKANPARSASRNSAAEANRITAQLNQQQLAANGRQTTAPAHMAP